MCFMGTVIGCKYFNKRISCRFFIFLYCQVKSSSDCLLKRKQELQSSTIRNIVIDLLLMTHNAMIFNNTIAVSDDNLKHTN